MTTTPRPGEIYQHFKGNLYRIVTLAEHSESGEQLVIYQALYDDFKVYARPLSMFMEKVDRMKYPQVQAEYRFTLLPLAEPVVQGEAAKAERANSCQPEMKEKQQADLKQEMSGQSACAAQDVSGKSVSMDKENAQQSADVEEEFALDPMLLAFLDADSYERKLEIFDSMHSRMDQSMLNTIAISLDLELSDGDLEEQYLTLRNCMLTLEKYECNRLR